MKSRSPAPGGKKSVLGGKRSELQDLPTIDSLPDGDRNYFVGGWSTEGSFTNGITNIANETKPKDRDVAAEEPMVRVATSLEHGRFVEALQHPDTITEFTRTNVVILPGVASEAEGLPPMGAGAKLGDAETAELTHGMFISGLLPAVMKASTAAFNARHPSADEADGGDAEAGAADGGGGGGDEEGEGEGEGDEGAERGTSQAPKPRYEITYRNPSAADDEDGGEADGPVDEDGNPVVPPTEEEVEAALTSLRNKGASVSPAEIVDFVVRYRGAVGATEAAARDPQSLVDTRFALAPASAAAPNGYAKPKRPTLYRKGIAVVDPTQLVVVRGAVAFKGIRPLVSVEAEAVTAARIASALGVPTVTPTDKSGKPKRKTDEEKQREAEAAAQLEEESLAAALAEGDRLSTFAIPDRYPTVYVSNLSFAGPITIQQAHMRFYRCHFSGNGFAAATAQNNNANNNNNSSSKSILVTVHQYCRVEFCECTFQQPQGTAIYAFPTAELFIKDTYFSKEAIPTTVDAAVALATLPPANSPFPSPGEEAIAVHADAAKVVIVRSHFEGFGNAVIIRNKFEVAGRGGGTEEGGEGGGDGGGGGYGVASEPNEDGLFPVRLRAPISTVTECSFINNGCASVCLVDARRTAVTRCYVNDDACGGYYSIQITGPKATPQITKCVVFGRVLVGVGSKPFLHKNTGKVQIIDKNQKEPSYMQPRY